VARKWIQSADVEVSEDGRLAVDIGDGGGGGGSGTPTSIACGTKTVAAAATPEALVAESTPCKRVWLGARYNAATGAALNTAPVRIGGSAGQAIPIMPGNFEGVTIDIDDAAKLYVDVAQDGEGVHYAILA
jgi:hypothetical protein